MGTLSSAYALVKEAGGNVFKKAFALRTSAGATDADKLVATNAAGVIDRSLTGGVTASSGSGDAGKPIYTLPDGTLDPTFLPSGIGAAVKQLPAYEAIGAGKFFNVFSDGGTAKMRLADNTDAGKRAHGFVKAAVAANATGTGYFDDANTAVTGLTPGMEYFLGTAGGVILGANLPTAANTFEQSLGIATEAGELNVEIDNRIIVN